MNMTLTVTAEWIKKSDTLHRIDIAGYTGLVEAVKGIYEITVFAGTGGRIVEVAHRTDQFAAFLTAERLIEEDVLAQTVSALIARVLDDEARS